MIPMDYETVTVSRSRVTMMDGRRHAEPPEPVGAIGVLVAPVTRERQLETGRVTLVSGYDLYRRGHAVLDIREGDLIDVRGETMTVTEAPMQWRRGSRTIGWQWHCERREDHWVDSAANSH